MISRDSTIFKVILASAVGIIVYFVLDSLFSGMAAAIAFIFAVLAAWFVIRR